MIRSISIRLAFLGIAILCLPALLAADNGVEIYSVDESYLPGAAQRIKIDMAFGDIRIEGHKGSDIEVSFRLTCRRSDLEKCRERARRIRLQPRVKGDRFVVRLQNTPRARIQGIRASMHLKVPRDTPLNVVVRSGDVFVSEVRSSVEIDVLNGHADVVAKRKQTGEVDVDVVAGKAELWLGDGHLKGAGWPRSIRWNGPGQSRLNVDVATGNARIRLE